MYLSLTDARSEIAERSTYLRAQWNRTEVQLEVIERVWPSLSKTHQDIQTETLGILAVKLHTARDKLNGLLKNRFDPGNVTVKGTAVRRWKYIFVKSYLDDYIKSLEKWQHMYDPSWYLIIRIASPIVDTELDRQDLTRPHESAAIRTIARKVRGALRSDTAQATHLALPSSCPENSRTSSIAYSSASYLQRPGKAGLIINSIQCATGSYAGELDKDVRALANKLHCADPATFGVLRCRGFAKTKSPNGSRLVSYDLVLETQTTDTPRTLRSCLIAQEPHSLTERIELAKQLSRSVNYVHTLDFVHKNIRPENLIAFGLTKLGPFFLNGFDEVRSADGMSYFRGDADWAKNLYRHPDRQGLNPGERYSMQHDIYSLGVCLLEIGLWSSFVLYTGNEKNTLPNTDQFGISAEALQKKTPNGIKRILVELARRELPAKMGDTYEEVVINCLSCLDEDNMDFGDQSEFDDAESVAVGIRYIEKVRTMPLHMPR